MSASFQIAINALSSWVATVVSSALGWVLVPIYLSELGHEGYGLLALTGSIIVFTAIADLMLREALARQLAAARGRNDLAAFSQWLSSARLVYGCLGLISGVSLVIAAPRLAASFKVSIGCLPDALFLLRGYAPAAILLAFIGSYYSAMLASDNRFDKVNFTTSVAYALRAVLLILVLKLAHAGLQGWAAITLSTEIGRVILLRWTAIRSLARMELSKERIRLGTTLVLARTGLCYFVAQSARLVLLQASQFILTVQFGPAVLALYSPVLQVFNSINPFVYALATQLSPLTTRLHVTEEREKLRQALTTGTRYVLLQGVGVVGFLFGFSDSLMEVWLGPRLGTAAVAIVSNVAIGLALVELTGFATGTQWAVLLGMNRLQVYLLTAPLAIVGFLIAAPILVAHTKLGLYGVIVSNLAISICIRLVSALYTAHACSLRMRDYFRLSYLRPACILLSLSLFSLALNRVCRPASYLALGGCAALVFAFWAALCWLVGFSDNDRLRVICLWRQGRALLQGGWTQSRFAQIPAPRFPPNQL